MNDFLDYVYKILINPAYLFFSVSITQILLCIIVYLQDKRIEKLERGNK